MRQVKAVLCLLMAASMLMSAASCGKKTEEKASLTDQSTQLLEKSDDDKDGGVDDDLGNDEDDFEDVDDDDDAPIDVEKLTIGKTTTTAASNSKSETTPARVTSGSAAASEQGAKSTTVPKAAATHAASGNTAKPTTTAATETAAEAPTELPATEAPPEEKAVSGIIDFNTNTFEGEGIALNGATYTITGEGTYILTGDLTGMVEINTKAKVKLKLNGVNIVNPGGPAILCTDAKRLTITLIEGTANYLTDGYSELYDGCICSNDTVEIKGAGRLIVNAVGAHGISSDDDVVIKNGEITIFAAKTGVMANDDITISGGRVRATGSTNGIKSKGTLHISGGELFAYGGGADKSAIYSGAVFSLTGGYVYALGCGTAQPDAASSTQCSICVRYNTDLAPDSWASINCDGLQFLNETSPYTFNTVFLSTPDVYDGMAFNVFANGAECGMGYTTAGMATALAVDVP